ncbi:chemotaxis protein CheW [Tautonia plasticadhaerens]|uniref:CheW-like domain protein n=1 Tax=Tautonia plasticadhaerens TaxID=2527974 RepID=A0A518GUT0_9BACT|nr:chemotaxis protein CheW [Tautonia plasticadhaerens]QDV32350.1 CheW-like domain protein [Tautonia plasticadhaerens]
MMVLTFEAGGERYGVDVSLVEEVVPRVALRRLPYASSAVAGLLDYRGEVVAVIDLGRLVDALPCEDRLSTRVVLFGADREGRRLGLAAERVSELSDVSGLELTTLAAPVQRVGFLGPVARVDGQLVQLIEPSRLLVEVAGRDGVDPAGEPAGASAARTE